MTIEVQKLAAQELEDHVAVELARQNACGHEVYGQSNPGCCIAASAVREQEGRAWR
jgi:hypothetical protein